MTVLFDLSPEYFPWRHPILRQIEQRRAQLSDALIFDILLSSGGIRHPDSLYPPQDIDALRNLLAAIEETTYDSLKKDCGRDLLPGKHLIILFGFSKKESFSMVPCTAFMAIVPAS